MAIPRGVYTSKVGGLDLPDELARMVNEAVTSNDGGDEAVIVESSRLQDQDILNRSERQEEQLVGHEESTEPPLSQEQVRFIFIEHLINIRFTTDDSAGMDVWLCWQTW